MDLKKIITDAAYIIIFHCFVNSNVANVIILVTLIFLSPFYVKCEPCKLDGTEVHPKIIHYR